MATKVSSAPAPASWLTTGANDSPNVELLALEMRRAVDEGVEVLLPAIDGEKSASEKRRTSRGLLRLHQTNWPDKIQIALRTLANHGAPWDDEGIEQLAQELAHIDVNLDSAEPRSRNLAALEPLADDARRQQFIILMERVLDTPTTSP